MSSLDTKKWIEIIDRDIEHEEKISLVATSKIGSALIIFGILIWFTYFNIYKSKEDWVLNYIILSFFLNIIQFSLFYTVLINGIKASINMKRLKSGFPVLSEDMVNPKKLGWETIILIIFIAINIYLLIYHQIYIYYFVLTTLISIMIGIIIWILFLIHIALSTYSGLLINLQYKILSEELKDVKKIREQFFKITELKLKKELIKDKNGKIKEV